MVRKIKRRGLKPQKVRHAPGTAGAGRKTMRMRKSVIIKRQPDAIIIPGITGPIIPTAAAAGPGGTVFVTAAKSVYRLKSYFGTGGKPLTKGQQAAYDKKQRYLKAHGGDWEYKKRTQTGVEKNFGDVPTDIFYSPRLGKKVALTGTEAPKRGTPLLASWLNRYTDDVYPGAQRDWLDTQMIPISGPAEAAAGGMKTKGMKIIKGKDKPIELALWNWERTVPKQTGGYYNLTAKKGQVAAMGRFQQSYISGRYSPKKGEVVSKAMLPPGRGIQTEYVDLYDQPGVAATLRVSKADKEGVVKKQIRKVVKKGKGTGKPSFMSRIPPVRIDDILRRSPTGKTKAVLKAGVFAKKQTKTGRYSLSTKKPFKRSARKGVAEGFKIDQPQSLLNESKLDKVFVKSLREKDTFTKTLTLGVWRKLSVRQKGEVLSAAGVI